MPKFFKLIGARSYFYKSEASGKSYNLQYGMVFSVDDKDYHYFLGKPKIFQEVDSTGAPLGIRSAGSLGGAVPISFDYRREENKIPLNMYMNPNDLSHLRGVLRDDVIKQLEKQLKEKKVLKEEKPKEEVKKQEKEVKVEKKKEEEVKEKVSALRSLLGKEKEEEEKPKPKRRRGRPRKEEGKL